MLGELESRMWNIEAIDYTGRLCTFFPVCFAIERGRLEASGRGQKVSESSTSESPPTRLALRKDRVQRGSIGGSGVGLRIVQGRC